MITVSVPPGGEPVTVKWLYGTETSDYSVVAIV